MARFEENLIWIEFLSAIESIDGLARDTRLARRKRLNFSDSRFGPHPERLAVVVIR
jgi:hypothetical protein